MSEAKDAKLESQKGLHLYAVWILRIVVGCTFVFSGFSKLVDPWGFIFKIEDYLAAMGIDPIRSLSMIGSIGIASFELICGLCLATGCFKRLSVWLLTLSMVVMLPLTLWVWIADPIEDCGCFGDALRISNALTFWKNVLLTAALAYLCFYNKKVRSCVFRPQIQWLVFVASFFYSLFVGLYGYNIQPMIDFRPYPVGSNLYESLVDGEIEDGADMDFVYEKDGERRVFNIDNLPDSTWTFVDRVVVEADTETPSPQAAFTIYDGDDDVTSEVLSPYGEQLLLVVPEGDLADISYSYTANEFHKAMERVDGSMVGLMSASPEKIADWVDISMSDYPYYTVEDTSLKQLARGTMSFVYLRDGVVQWKRTLSTFDFDTVDRIGNGEMAVADLVVDDESPLKNATIYLLLFLAILATFQQIILKIWHIFKKESNFALRKQE